MNDSAMNKLKNMDNIESLLFQVEGSNFANFEAMEGYLEAAEKTLDSRLRGLGEKMEGVGEELKRTAGVYQFNNKKRLKEEEYLQMERQKLKRKMQDHQSKINLTVHPITLVLKEKRSQIQRLAQTKEIVQDFNKIMGGKQEDLAKVLPLDERNFNASALKVYVFKCLLDQMGHQKYQLARLFIRKKFLELKTRILSNFKEGFLKKDVIMLNNILPYCEEYELMQQVSDYYNQQAFKESHPLQKIQREMITPEIQNFFFLLKRGFQYAFSTTVNGNQKNGYKINVILSKYSDLISRRLISIVFQRLVKESIDSILKSFQQSSDYLQALQLLYSQCKALLKECESLIQQDKLVHLMQTYMESIFDIYLENYINKELHSLGRSYEENIGLVIQQMRAIDALQQQDEVRKDSKKFSFKKLMDYKIETKKQYNPVYVKSKLQALSAVFMDPALQKIFQVTKYALIRNNKISKLNEMDKNRNQILSLFLKQLGQLINNIIGSMRDLLPGFEEGAAPLQHEFFHIVPQVNVLLQRMECLYSEHKKQARYQLAESIKLEQKKEDLVALCARNLNKLVADALACILTSQKTILRERTNYISAGQPISGRLHQLLEKYVKAINNRINQFSYRQTLLKTLGVQFVNLLIQHYSLISYSKQGLGALFVDVSGFAKLLKLFPLPPVQQRFRVFKSLIDIYVLRNEQKELSGYLKGERQGQLAGEKEEVLKAYLANKQRVERT